MSLPIEETNLACIGSDSDKAAREAAARMEFSWSSATGSEPGVEIWRVEDARTESGNPDFGIAAWPEKKNYGKLCSIRFMLNHCFLFSYSNIVQNMYEQHDCQYYGMHRQTVCCVR